jgi:AraC-like DNA-binding protein/mannose-6-phosphate isomerase-like protein (cupin superfamily)
MADIQPNYRDYHDTGRPAAVLEIDYPDGYCTGWHTHPRAQLVFAIQGVMHVRTRTGSWIVPPNRAVWLSAGLEHEVRMCGAVRMRTLFVAPEASPHLPRTDCVISVSPLLRELLVAAVSIPIDYDPASRDGRLVGLLLDELRTLDVIALHLPTPSERRLRQVCEAISQTPDDSSSAAVWARRLGITAKTLHRLFRQHTGMSFAQWRQQARLLQALEHLAAGRQVIDVAADCGYASQSAFTAMFRRQFDVPPSVFFSGDRA